MISRNMWLAAVLLLLQGCVTINDNTDDCFPLARLRFTYTYNLAGEDRFANQVESLDLYAFRQKDSTLVATRHIPKSELARQNYNVSLQWLRLGDYYIVAFGNKKDGAYNCANYEHMADLKLRMICGDGLGTITKNPPAFFYGMVKLNRDETGDKVVAMIKDTNDIVVRVHDLTPEGTRALGAREMEVNVTAKNGTINHDNTLSGEDTRQMKHITYPTQETIINRFSSATTVGRLFDGDGTALVLKEKETGKILATENITETIVELLKDDEDYAGMDPNEYLDKQDTFTFIYKLELEHGVLVATLVRVNGWNKVEQGGNGGILW